MNQLRNHLHDAHALASSLNETTRTTKRIIQTVQGRLTPDGIFAALDLKVEIVRDFSLALAGMHSWVNLQEQVGYEAQRHVHEGSEVLRLISERLPKDVLAARSRRPGRHS